MLISSSLLNEDILFRLQGKKTSVAGEKVNTRFRLNIDVTTGNVFKFIQTLKAAELALLPPLTF